MIFLLKIWYVTAVCQKINALMQSFVCVFVQRVMKIVVCVMSILVNL